jgi:hypothetical protein
MKTVAVCISGQFRSFDKCLPSIFKNLILTNSNYELKFFTSFAKEENKPINIPTEFFKISSVIKIEEDSVLPDLSYQKSKYKYLDYQLDSENDTKLIYYQLKQFQSVFNMVKEYEKDNNMTFDYVMRLRPDLEFKSIFNWNLFEDSIITPSEDHFRGYNDRFAVGPRNLMELYMNRLGYWMSENDDINFTTQNEVNLKHHLDNHNILVNNIPIDLQYIRYNDFSKTKLKITSITNDEAHFINVTDDELPIKVRICCGKGVVYSKKLDLPPHLYWWVGSPNKCDNKKVIFQGNDLYLEYKMN